MMKKILMAVFVVSCLVFFGGGSAWADFEVKDGRLTAASDIGEFDVNTEFESFLRVVDLEGNFPDHTTVRIELWYDGTKMEGVVFEHHFQAAVYGEYDAAKANFFWEYRYGNNKDEYWTFSNGVTAWKAGMYIFKVKVEGVELPDFSFYYVGPRYNLPEPGEFVASWTDDQSGEGNLYALWNPAGGFMPTIGFKTIIYAEVFRYLDKGPIGVIALELPGHYGLLYYPRSLIKLCEKFGAQVIIATVITMTNDGTASIRRRGNEVIGLPDETTEVRLPLAVRIAATGASE